MFPKKKKNIYIYIYIKLDKLVVEKFPVVAHFHDVIKSCHDPKSSCLPLFLISRGFYLGLDTMIDS